MNLIDLRKRLGLTQTEMARRLGVSFVTVNRWENGHCRPSPLAKRYIDKLQKEIDDADTGIVPRAVELGQSRP